MHEFSTLFQLDSGISMLLAMLCLVFAYTIFNLVGFGSALIAGAPLAMLMPVNRVIPLLALLDFSSAAGRAWQQRKDISRIDLYRLLPGMLGGQLLGVFLLARLPTHWMASLLGGFILVQGLRGLSQASRPRNMVLRAWPSALTGGILGGLFGSGGFMYASYLERSLPDRDAFRATQAVLIGLSTAWRLVLCLFSGLLDFPMLLTVLLLFPALPAGQWLARRIDLRLSRRQLGIVLNLLLLCAGGLLLWRQLLA